VIINNGFSEKIGDRLTFQKMYEIQRSMDGFLEPTRLVEKVKTLIEKLGIDQEEFKQNSQNVFKNKNNVPLKQLFALYAINKIASKVNMNE
jgi:DNA (cytosine-5)-methyltransferase 1